MKRLGALVLAVLMVTAAAWLADAIWGDDSTSAGNTNDNVDNVDNGGDDNRPVRLRCSTEFEAACTALRVKGVTIEVTVEAPGDTADALAKDPTPEFDLWLTSEPWPEIATIRADFFGSDAPKVGKASSPLGVSPLQIAATRPRAAGIGRACESSGLTGQCLSTVVGRPFSDLGVADDIVPLTLGFPKPETTAGLLTVGALSSGWYPDGFDTVDVDVNDALRGALKGVAQASKLDGSPIKTLLTIPKFSAAVDLRADRQLAATPRNSEFTTMSFTPPVNALAVVVAAKTTRGSAAARRVTTADLRAALRADGWQAANSSTTSNLPDAGVLEYLVTRSGLANR